MSKKIHLRSEEKPPADLEIKNARHLCDGLLVTIKNDGKSFPKHASMMNRDTQRDPNLASVLTFLRFNKQTTCINLEPLQITVDGQPLYINKTQPGTLDLATTLTVNATTPGDLFNAWGWTEDSPEHTRKKMVFTYILESYTQGMLKQSFLPSAIAYNKETNKEANTCITPDYSWDESNALIIDYKTCPKNRYSAAYAKQIRITNNDMTITLYCGLTYRLHQASVATEYAVLKQRLVNMLSPKITPWLNRYGDKCAGASAFALMAAGSSIAFGVLFPELTTLMLALIATAITVSTIGAAVFTGLSVRAHTLFSRQNPAKMRDCVHAS